MSYNIPEQLHTALHATPYIIISTSFLNIQPAVKYTKGRKISTLYLSDAYGDNNVGGYITVVSLCMKFIFVYGCC